MCDNNSYRFFALIKLTICKYKPATMKKNTGDIIKLSVGNEETDNT